jgi:hypothetical protein
VSGGIFFSEIGFDFDDAGREAEWPIVANQKFAEEFPGYAARITSEKSAGEWLNRRGYWVRMPKRVDRSQKVVLGFLFLNSP